DRLRQVERGQGGAVVAQAAVRSEERREGKGCGVGGGAAQDKEVEDGSGEDLVCVLVGRRRAVDRGRGVVDRAHVDRLGRLVGARVEAAVGGAAVVLDRELEARVGRAVGVGGRAKEQVAGGELGGADRLRQVAGGQGGAVVAQAAV